MIILQILCWILATVYLLVGKVAALFMVPIGIWTNWEFKPCWPWDALENTTTGEYYDWWYSKKGHSNHTKLTAWAWEKGGFWREYIWRIRNGFSNGMRYMVPNTPAEDLITENWKHGIFQYDARRPWLSRMKLAFRPDWAVKRGRYIQVYIGFKVNRSEGSGFTNRLFRLRRDD